MIARYDLSDDIASFDYYSWQALAVAKGCTEIVFCIDRVKETKWPADVVLRRFESIIKPGPALLGIPWRMGSDGERVHHPSMISLVEWVRAGNDFPRLKSVLPPGKECFTITMRRDARLPHFNSNEAAWRTFAQEIGARVIEDYDDQPLSLHERFALYAGAEMNFGVVTGPMHLIVCSDHPMMMFNCSALAEPYRKCGMEFGEQYPWARPNQMAIWEPDSLDVLRRCFDAWAA